MQPVYLTQSGTGTSGWLLLNPYVTPMNVGVGLLFTGAATASVQYTFEDTGGVYPNPQTSVPTAFTLLTAAANATGSISFPVAAVRLNVAAGTGTVTLAVVQAGIGGP